MANEIHVAELADAIQFGNGKLFRWRDGRGIMPANNTTAPNADANSRGYDGLTQGAAGVADAYSMVVKNAADAYAACKIPVYGNDIIVVSNAAVVSLTNNSTSAQNIFPAANDALTVEASTTYLMLGRIGFNTGATDHVTSLGFALSSATLTSIAYVSDTISSAAATLATPQRKRIETNSATAVCATSTAVQTDITLRGIMRVNAAGTITPQVTFSAGPTGTCETDADSFLMLIKLGSGSFAAIGPWA